MCGSFAQQPICHCPNQNQLSFKYDSNGNSIRFWQRWSISIFITTYFSSIYPILLGTFLVWAVRVCWQQHHTRPTMNQILCMAFRQSAIPKTVLRSSTHRRLCAARKKKKQMRKQTPIRHNYVLAMILWYKMGEEWEPQYEINLLGIRATFYRFGRHPCVSASRRHSRRFVHFTRQTEIGYFQCLIL